MPRTVPKRRCTIKLMTWGEGPLDDSGLPAEGLATAQGLILTAQGLLTLAGAQGLDWTRCNAQGLVGRTAQGLVTAQGFAAMASFPRENSFASCRLGPKRVMAKTQGRSENRAPRNQPGPGSIDSKNKASSHAPHSHEWLALSRYNY